MEDYRILNANEIVEASDEVENQCGELIPWTTDHIYGGKLVKDCKGFETGTQRTFRRKVEKQMFYRVPIKSNLFAGKIVKLVRENSSMLLVQTHGGPTVEYPKPYLKPIQVKVTKTLVSPASKLISILEDDGYVIDSDGWWAKKGNPSFGSKMFKYIGKELPSGYDSNPNWFKEKWGEIKPEVDYKKFIVDFMKLKRELSHPSYLYERDIDEIMEQWSEEECKSIYEKFKNCTFEPNFGPYWCAFCIRYKKDCLKCSYGTTHGICLQINSDYQKHIAANMSTDLPELTEFIKNS